jgi:hypothetical protein
MNKLGILFWSVFGLLVVAADPAEAQSAPLGKGRVWNISCGTTAATLKPPTKDSLVPYKEFRVWNNSATVVYLGGSDVTQDTTKGYPICTTAASCEQAGISIAGFADSFSCRTASGTATVVVFAGA